LRVLPKIGLILFILSFSVLGQTRIDNSESSGYEYIPIRSGEIRGRITDANTKHPLVGVNVILLDANIGSSTDLEGEFALVDIPIGAYRLKCSSIGHETLIVPDVIVKPQRITTVNIELMKDILEGDEVTVHPRFFADVEHQPVSSVSMSGEEVRRTPGSAGDVSRIVMALPSVAKVNDTRNSLVVRGGSPIENGYYLNNIAIPNINHFPLQGASSGALPLLNVDFIDDVKFYTGGFSAIYGDKLSSIMDIAYRDGNKYEFDGQLDLNMSGFGGIIEGPLIENKSSWFLSARRSYFDLIIDLFDIEASTTPYYYDIQGKVDFELNSKNKISFLDIAGFDESVIDKELSVENRENNYGSLTNFSNVFGVNWRHIWHHKGYSNTSISHSYIDWDSEWYETLSDYLLTTNQSNEQNTCLRNVNHYSLNPSNSVEFGFEASYLAFQLDKFYNAYTDPLGNPTPPIQITDNIQSVKFGGFLDYNSILLERFNIIPSMRYDYFEYNGNQHISPRLNLGLRLDSKTTLTAAIGRFYQILPMLLLAQNDNFKKLDDPFADHYILGISRLLTDDTRLTFEVYDKEYSDFPMDPNQPSIFIIDQSNNQDGFSGFINLVDTGKAFTRGVELMVQKKLAKNYYGLVSASYFKSRYKGLDGKWRDRTYDNRYMFTIEGGYKPNYKWEFSVRWIFAGGVPYTPFDIEASETSNREVLDSENVNGERLPDYHSLNLRADRRFHFKASNLIIYLSIWNAYNRQNIASYFWNELDNKPDVFEQWGILTVLGIEYEF